MLYTAEFLGEKATIDQIENWLAVRFSFKPSFGSRVVSATSIEFVVRNFATAG